MLRRDALASNLTGVVSRRYPDGTEYHRFAYTIVRLWELHSEKLLEAGLGALPKATVDQPSMVTVKWKTCDISHIKFVNNRAVDPDSRCTKEWHEATVPVHFADQQLGNLNVHFLPENKIEVWSVLSYAPYSPHYPGPAYPRSDPGPDYASPSDDKRLIKKVQP